MSTAATAILLADDREPDLTLNHPEVKRLLDFSRPAAVLFITLLHYIVDDDQAPNSVRTFRDVLVPGSYIITLWHPEDPDDVFLDRPEAVLNWGGIGRKVK